jgi:hypothetical protein
MNHETRNMNHETHTIKNIFFFNNRNVLSSICFYILYLDSNL